MADNLAVTPGTGATVAMDEVTDGTLGSVKVQYVKIMDGTLDATTKVASGSGTGNGLRVVVDSSQLATLLTAQTTVSAGAQQVVLPTDHAAIVTGGNVAHDAVDSGNPMKQGFKATTALSGLTLVSSADRTDGFAGVDGVQIVRPHCNLEDIVSGLLANTDGASTSVIAAQGAGIKTYITSVIIANSSATAVTVDLRDGAAGSVKATFPVPASTSGVVCNLPVPLGFTANTAVCMDGSAAASTVTCTLIGFKSKV